jgi:hypothetical protein
MGRIKHDWQDIYDVLERLCVAFFGFELFLLLCYLYSVCKITENCLRCLTLKRSEILNILKRYKNNYQKKYHFRKIGIFGSVARGTAGIESDFDIVIEQSEPDLFLLGSIIIFEVCQKKN